MIQKSSSLPEVLCVSDFFLPGFKGGGPIRTLENMRKLLTGEVAFSIFTRDRDLGSDAPYANVTQDTWLDTPSGPIYYAAPKYFGIRGLKKVLAERRFDVVYLNSFFSLRGSVLLNLWLQLSSRSTAVLLAPRGEFSQGALEVKRLKKCLFLRLARASGMYRKVYWHASTELEAADILRQFPDVGEKILIAPDPVIVEPSQTPHSTIAKRTGLARIVFISRISPKKNLEGLLDYLRGVEADVELDIFGPIEDSRYWERCHALISRLPSHVTARYQGLLSPDEVSQTFAKYDIFAFPTHGENFGHVIFEALRAGTPVLLSNQTPWQQDESGAATVLPLEDASGWQRAIEATAARSESEQAEIRAATLEYAKRYAETDMARQANRALFHSLA